MKPLRQNLLDYLQTLTGAHLDLVLEEASALPFFLRTRYDLCSLKLFGRRFLLALETGAPDSPSVYEAQTATLSQRLGEPVTVVLPALPSAARNRMVQRGIPFIVPGSQMFLPNTLIDLRERQPKPAPEPIPGKPLTPAAQCVLLTHLQREPLDDCSLSEIATKVGYSPIMLTKVKAELEAAHLCEAIREGRSHRLRFTLSGRTLWEKAVPLLASPVRNRHWMEASTPSVPALLAGMSALSQCTLLEDDRLPTYAVSKKSLPALIENGTFRQTPGSEEATFTLETWHYDPDVLFKRSAVDPLSLYLSLRDSPDERVQQQLELLLEGISW